MAEVIITIKDTGEDQFSATFHFDPEVVQGQPVTPAQELGLNLAEQFQLKEDAEADHIETLVPEEPPA